MHARWRAKELASIYAFLVATWGQWILFFMVGLAFGVTYANQPDQLQTAILVITIIEGGVFLGGLIWAAVLGSQAAKIKKMLGAAATYPPSYYPRPGQAVLHNPDPTPASPPASGETLEEPGPRP